MKTVQVKTIRVTADSLKEARENVRQQIPDGFFLLSEQIIADGTKLETVKAVAETADVAVREAEAQLPKQVIIVEKKTLVAPSRSTVQIEAFSEQEARSLLRHRYRLLDTAEITAVKMLSAGKKGFLGIGKEPNQYQCEVLQQAVVAVTYRQKSQVLAKVGDRNFALVKAAGEGEVRRVTDLLDQGADVDSVDEEGFTPLKRASYGGHADVVRLLLTRGADAGSKGSSGATAFMNAFACNHVEVVEALLAAGANPDEELKEGMTPLMGAAVEAHMDMLKLLLKAGANVNATIKNGATALMGVATYGNVAIGNILLDHNADPNVSTAEGSRTALIEASQHGHTEFVKMLLTHGARVDAKMNDGKTALLIAAIQGHAAVVRTLLNSGADINQSDESGNTALIGATLNGSIEVVKLLIDSGADVNARNRKGLTARGTVAVSALLGVSYERQSELASILTQAGGMS